MSRTLQFWLLLSLSLTFGCSGGPDDPVTDDDDTAPADDDDTATADDDDTLSDDDDSTPIGPPGSVVATVFDSTTSEPIPATIHEHQSDPINAVGASAVGEFVLYPQTFGGEATTQFFAYDTLGDYVELFVAMTEDAYLLAGQPLELGLSPWSDWEDTHLELFGSAWDPALGLLVFEFDFLDIEDIEGTAVWIDAPHGTAFAYDGSGALVESSEVPFGSAQAQVVVTAVSPAPVNVEVMPKAGIECFGPSSFDTLDNAILYALYTCRPVFP